MNLAFTIEASDLATPMLQRMAEGLTPERINPRIGESVKVFLMEHFMMLNAERHRGGTGRGYYADAARSTNWRNEAGGVSIFTSQVGMTLHFYGGTVYPGKSVSKITGKPTQHLSIPAREEAYGHVPSDFGKDGLEILFGKNGPYALAYKRDYTESTRTIQSGARKGETVTTKSKKGVSQGGILFWLLKQATIRADKSVLPGEFELLHVVEQTIDDYQQLLQARAA